MCKCKKDECAIENSTREAFQGPTPGCLGSTLQPPAKEYDEWNATLYNPEDVSFNRGGNFAKYVREKKIQGVPGGCGPYGIDPKESQASKKLSFDNIPISLLVNVTKAAECGAIKYGPYNWLELPDGSMSIMTYLNAVQRHLLLYRAGQDEASDSGLHHLDHIIAGLAVLRDAMLFGKTKDDRIKLSEKQIKSFEERLNNE